MLKFVLNRVGAYNCSLHYLQKTAIHYYKKRIEKDSDLKVTVDVLNEMGTLRNHYGDKKRMESNTLLHLSIQLAEFINTLKERLQPIDSNYQNAAFLDAGDSDGIVLKSIGCRNGASLNISDSCVKQIRSVGGMAIKGDVQAMPFKDDSFDYVICFETLEHLKHPIQGLEELSRVCFKKIFVTIPWVKETRIHESNGIYGKQHIFEFSQNDFKKVVTHTGLKITYYKEIRIFPRVYNPINNLLLKEFYYPSFFPKFQFYELTKKE